MGIYVKGGTPVGTVSLCSTCSHAHCVEGYRESEVIVLCTFASYNNALPITFKVRSCSNHEDRSRPTWSEMKKLAVEITPPVRFKTAGFLTVPHKVEVKDLDDDDE